LAAVLDGDEAIPGVVDEGVALVVGREVTVGIEGQRRASGGGFFVLLAERVVDRAAAVGRRGREVAERVERPGDGVASTGDRVVVGVQRATGEGN